MQMDPLLLQSDGTKYSPLEIGENKEVENFKTVKRIKNKQKIGITLWLFVSPNGNIPNFLTVAAL